MPKARVWDIKGMSIEELHDLVRRCEAEEQRLKAPYKKGRRDWVRLRGEAEEELTRRGQSA
jgi:hypothetical protein